MKELLGWRTHTILNESKRAIEARRDDETRTLITTIAPGDMAVIKVSSDKPIVLSDQEPRQDDASPLLLDQFF